MTLATLASQLRISLQQLAKYESGRNKIDATHLESIAKILRVSTEELTQESPFEAALSELGLGLGDLLHDPLLIRLLQAWVWIERSEHRGILLQLIKALDPANAARPKGEVQP